MMKINYIIPALTEYTLLPDDTLNQIFPENLLKILKYSDKNEATHATKMPWLSLLLDHIHSDQDIPYVFLRLAYENPTFFNPKSQNIWLCADPVHIQILHDQLVLVDEKYLDLTEAESEEIVIALNDFLKNDGIQVHMTSPSHFYFELESDDLLKDCITTPLHHVVGRHIEHFLPQGEKAQYWRKLFNEIQMFLHTLPLNEAREAAGKLPINGLWFWGNALHSSFSPSIVTQRSTVFCRNPFLLGLKKLAPHLDIQLLPSALDTTILSSINEEIFIVLDDLIPFLHYQDIESYRDTILALDQHYFSPTWNLFKNQQIQNIKMIFPSMTRTVTYSLSSLNLYKFWRRTKTLTQFL